MKQITHFFLEGESLTLTLNIFRIFREFLLLIFLNNQFRCEISIYFVVNSCSSQRQLEKYHERILTYCRLLLNAIISIALPEKKTKKTINWRFAIINLELLIPFNKCLLLSYTKQQCESWNKNQYSIIIFARIFHRSDLKHSVWSVIFFLRNTIRFLLSPWNTFQVLAFVLYDFSVALTSETI